MSTEELTDERLREIEERAADATLMPDVTIDLRDVPAALERLNRVAECDVPALTAEVRSLRARLTLVETDGARTRQALKSLLALDTPWPLVEVLTMLMQWSEHLLHEHDCDHHGYETLCAALGSAREQLDAARALAPSPAHAAGEPEQHAAPTNGDDR